MKSSPIATQLRIVVILFLVEGAARKWLGDLPGFALSGARELLMLAMLFNAPKNASGREFDFATNTVWLILLGNTFIILTQYLAIHHEFRASLIGFKYWVIAPLWAFLVIRRVDFADIHPSLTVLWRSAIPMTVLAAIQNAMPPEAWINHLPNATDGNVMTVAGDIVRVSGTFTHPIGYAVYLSILTPILLSPIDNLRFGPSRIDRRAQLSAATQGLLCLVGLIFFSGSRSAWALGAITIGFWLTLHALNSARPNSTSLGGFWIKILLAAPLLLILIGSEGRNIGAMEERVQNAADAEKTSGRIQEIFLGEPYAWQSFIPMGYGIGLGSNVQNVISGSDSAFALAETEPGRLVMEAGVWGICIIFIKFAFSILLIRNSLHLYLKTGSVFGVLISLQTCLAFLSWPASGQISASFGLFFLAVVTYTQNRSEASGSIALSPTTASSNEH